MSHFQSPPPKSLKYGKMKLATLLLYFVVISNSLSSAYCRNSASIPFFRYPKEQLPLERKWFRPNSKKSIIFMSSFGQIVIIPLFQKTAPKIFQYPLLATRTLLIFDGFFPFLKRVRDMDSFPGSSPEHPDLLSPDAAPELLKLYLSRAF